MAKILLKKLIHENLEEKSSLVEVAVRICPTYLSEQFKKVTGQNFVDYVARARVEKVCALLRTTRARISEIAFASGLQSLSQFNRVFKKVHGISRRGIEVKPATTARKQGKRPGSNRGRGHLARVFLSCLTMP